MSEKTLKTRIQNKRGTTAEWATGTAPNFVPLDGELIVYKDVNKIKIGNGTSKVGDLPFVASNGLDALVFNGFILVGTVPSVGQTFSYGPTTSFNRTPAVGDNFIALIGYKSIEDDYLCQCRITAVNSPSFTATYVNVTKATGTDGVDGKVKDVTLDGESIVNADGVVELHPTAMTDGYVPVWNNTTKVFEDGIAKTNIVTRDTDQSLTGHKTFDAGFTTTAFAAFNASATFNEDLTLACPIIINNSAGTAGQVLTSNGAGNAPIWKDISTPSNMVTTDTSQTITGSKTFSGGVSTQSNLSVYSSMIVANNGSGITLYNSNGSLSIDLKLDEDVEPPEMGAAVYLPVVELSQASSLYLIGAADHGTRGKVLTSAASGNAATWSTLPAFGMNTALPISYRLSTSSNGYYNSVTYGTASAVNCSMTRNLADHTSLARHISYCIHLSTVIAAGKWVRFDVPSISYNNTTYWPYIKTITATAIKTSTSSTPPAIITYITNNQTSGGYAYVGCCSQQISGLDVRIDCTVS